MEIVENSYRGYCEKRKITLVAFSLKRSKHRCDDCGFEWEKSPVAMLRTGSGCKRCAVIKTTVLRQKRAEAEYKVICKEKKLKLLERYQGKNTPTKHKCLVCKNTWTVKPNDITNAKPGYNRCPTCKIGIISVKSQVSDKEHTDAIDSFKKVKVLEIIRPSKGRFKAKVRCLVCKAIFISGSDLKQGHGCPDCAHYSRQLSGKKYRKIRLKGKTFTIQGYESHALRYLVNKKRVPVTKILAGLEPGIPVIGYTLGKTKRKYFPDMYLPSKNILVEVKSTYTLGLSDRKVFYVVREKARACVALEYDYRLLIMSPDGTRYKTPKNWTTLSWSVFVKEFNFINEI